jgi:4-hydroxybenzoate polyprenyltransferase
VIECLRAFFAPMRADTWWEFKTPIFLGVAYLAAVAGHVPFAAAWPAFVVGVLALIPLASFVCVINDIADERADRAAGKSNRMLGRSTFFKVAWLAACLGTGVAVAWVSFRGTEVALLLYVANWVAFVLYSLPPIRLKERGLAGVFADALGGTALPVLWWILLTNPVSSAPFLAVAGAWSLAFGLRGILYHQTADIALDQASGVKTFAVRVGLPKLRRLVVGVIFPVELSALACLLWMSGSAFVVPILAVYVFTQFALWKWLRIRNAVADAGARTRLLLLKYYQLWFPLTFILSLGCLDSRAFLLLPLHGLAFPDTWRRFGRYYADIRHNLRYPPDWDSLTSSSK